MPSARPTSTADRSRGRAISTVQVRSVMQRRPFVGGGRFSGDLGWIGERVEVGVPVVATRQTAVTAQGGGPAGPAGPIDWFIRPFRPASSLSGGNRASPAGSTSPRPAEWSPRCRPG